MNATKARPKTKFCTGCEEHVSVLQYYKRAASKDGLAHHCKNCRKEANAVWRASNPDRCRQYNRRWARRVKYGLSPAKHAEMLQAQDAQCAICGRGGLLCVDHDHETGRVRGLLCTPCNTALGGFRDSPGLLDKAKQYLSDFT